MFKTCCVLSLAALALLTNHAVAAPERALSVVLVHGAFVDGSGWEKVYSLLKKDGYEVIVVQNSTATLDGDVATTRRAIATAKHPVILVGHSYGGAVITEAGNDPKVQRLVYLAAYLPDAGESVAAIIAQPVPGALPVPILPPQNGFLTLDVAKFPKAFAPDVDPSVSAFMAASQVPWGQTAVATKIAEAAWKTKPTWDLVTTNDHMIPTSQQRDMAARAHAYSAEIASSHAVMLSHPTNVATFIEKAATAP
jgi:pimeloyl-ACP methyl ester carboxylesterase